MTGLVRPTAILLLIPPAVLAEPSRKPPVDFVREVRPILASKCFSCHGPDASTRKGGLRLDERDAATRPLRSGSRAIVPGDAARSELIVRITTDDETSIMPPRKAGKRLSPAEVDLLRRWITEEAPYPGHWAWTRPARRPLPAVRDPSWGRNPIDRLVLARLDREGLKPAPEADRLTLLRRVTLDLTGLPPTLVEAEQFLADTQPGAYDRLVDRLLASPAYGERWASPWLDLARYADSQGYANDPDRTIWPWRDWVVQALNANQSYDQFTIEQMAGDLIPGATLEQRIATGFHRNTLTNTEGGTSPEEFRSAAIVDRVNTTFQVWMGTTMACAQCHNHKYDPITQKEYYQLYAIFNNTEDANRGDDAPVEKLPLPGEEMRWAQTAVRLLQKNQALAAETRRLDAGLPQWEKEVDRTKLPREIAALLDLPPAKRSDRQKQQLLTHVRRLSETYRSLEQEVKELDTLLKKTTVTTPILREGKPRPTHIHIRGEYLEKGEAVTPGLPALFTEGRGRTGDGINRLTLARWLVSERNPLTARVAVNRLWEELFGIGIVETSEEFGTQGDLPSHPDLLDWLAIEYIRSGWDTKRLLRLIATSATYRQDARVSAESARRDPRNRLLARGPRVRLSAEAVRDQALFVAGLLSRTMGGPPVQPARPRFGLSAAFGSGTDWTTSAGTDRHRRGLYTRWRRNAPYPSATTFDAPERTSCTVRRVRTNTPLQALVTLNDPVFFEAAQGLARRIAAQPGTVAEKVSHAFRLCLTRMPTEPEVNRLVHLYQSARARYADRPRDAEALATRPIGPLPAGVEVTDVAAWTVLGNVLLNLDEMIHKR